MKNEFTAIFERDGGCYIAYYPEIPGANDQEKTKEDTPGRLLHSFRQDEGRAREERRSLTVGRERYKDNAEYVQKLALAARTLIEERLLLPEDAARIIAAARKNGAVAMKAQ
jgi:hypothetical protein